MTHARPEPHAAPVAPGEHTEREDHAWAVSIPDHPARTESEDFRRSKATAHKILSAAAAGSDLISFLSGRAA